MIRREAPAVGLTFAAALAVRLISLTAHPFNGLYGQDAYTYYAMAEALAGIRPYDGVYIWGVGYPALLASGLRMFGGSVGVAQAISVVMDATLSPLIYALARLNGTSRIGSVFAALLLALCGQAALSSLCIMSDIPALFWVTASTVALFASRRTHQTGLLMASAALLTMAAITRWNYAILAPLWIGLWLASDKKRWRDGFAALVACGLIALPEILFSFSRPSPVFFNFGSWDAARLWQSHFVTSEGTFSFAQINAAFYARPVFDAFWLSPVFGVMAGVGVIRWAGVGRIRINGRNNFRPYGRETETVEIGNPATRLFFTAWLIVAYVFLCGLPQQSERYGLILLPPLLVFAGMGFDWLWASRTAWVRVGVAVVSALGGISMARAANSEIAAFIAAQESDKAVVQAVIATLPDDITLYTFELTAPLRFDAPFIVRDLYDETPASITANRENTGKTYLLIDTSKIRSRWSGMPIENTFNAIIRAYNMRRVGLYRQYTLYQAVIPLPRRS